MGCTSSAPTMTPAHANAAENNLQVLEDEIMNENKTEDSVKEKSAQGKDCDNDEVGKEHDDDNVKMELPTCDTTETLARNNAPIVDASSLDTLELEDFHEKNESEQIESEPSNNTPNSNDKIVAEPLEISTSEHTEIIQTEEKLSTLEEVVEKVVEYYVTDKLVETVHSLQKDSNVKDKNEARDILDLQASSHKESAPAPSPSRSADSRATRWEALADVAAELPPSLTVDPLTGQIYALTK